MFTVTTPVGPDVVEAATFVQQLCPSARPTYALGGTQKYELPTSEVPVLHQQCQAVLTNLKPGILELHASVAVWMLFLMLLMCDINAHV